MLDLVSSEFNKIDSSFLDPACGTGNFLLEILDRKLKKVVEIIKTGYQDFLPCEYNRQSLMALSSIYGIDILPDNIPKAKEPIVSLDPGIRSFQTYYSLTGTGSIGQNVWEKILGYCYQLDKLISRLSKAHGSRRQNLKRAAVRLRYRIKCLKDELHNKVAVWLCKNYKTIMIPEFSAMEMSAKHKRKLTRKTVRSMLNLGHSQFRNKLVQLAEVYGSQVIFVNESYTSKTCTACGHIHEKLGSSKVFKCPACGTVLSRDINGARNIMLRAMLEQTAGIN